MTCLKPFYFFQFFLISFDPLHLLLILPILFVPLGFVEVGLVPLAQELREVEESSLDTKWGQVVVRRYAVYYEYL